MDEIFALTDKVIVITGGTGAIGSELARALSARGAHVVILARDEQKIEQLLREITDQGGAAVGYSCDVLDKDRLVEVAAQIKSRFDNIDILINGAGGNKEEATAQPDQRTFFDLPAEALRWVVDLNLMGTILPSQVFGEEMTKSGAGIILNVSSMASYQPLTRVVGYGAAKASVNNFTQWLAVYMATEHSPDIRVNAIAPGFFLGEQNRYLLLNDDDSLTQRGQQIIDHTPMNRFGDTQDLIGTAMWLISDASRFVTGVVVPVDGGFSAFSGV